MINRFLREFIKLEASGGIVLVVAAGLALWCANSQLEHFYHAFVGLPVTLPIPGVHLPQTVHMWVSDGLMVLFFLVVGLEIKRELAVGQLSSWKQLSLPLCGALGGMITPATIYILCNQNSPELLRGWAIPTATDIAFSLGVLALFSKRVPFSLKVFLTALAVLDDLGAILVIAFFYTTHISYTALVFALLLLLLLILLNKIGVESITVYVILGVVLWLCVLESGVHATLAGVLVAFCIPLQSKRKAGFSPLEHLVHALHPWVTYGILPFFAFCSSGVSLQGLSLSSLLEAEPFGIAAGLFFGKQAGVFAFSRLAVALGISKRPTEGSWLQFYGVCILTGIGFTMSLFIGELAFRSGPESTMVRLGVLSGSLASALAGAMMLAVVRPALK